MDSGRKIIGLDDWDYLGLWTTVKITVFPQRLHSEAFTSDIGLGAGKEQLLHSAGSLVSI